MGELINAVVNIRTPLTLFAFLSLLLLMAFRTKKVPELFFQAVSQKLTRERFAQLLQRSMTYGFAAFIVVCATAVAAQVLAIYARPKPVNLDAFTAELKDLKASSDATAQALADYKKGWSLMEDKKFDEAIAAMESSLQKVPTASAQLTVAYLYDQVGQHAMAKKFADQARETAQKRGDVRSATQAKQIADGSRTEVVEAGALGPVGSMLGPKTPLPSGGDACETATPISPGVYIGQVDSDRKFYRIAVAKQRTLSITFRLRDSSTQWTYVRIHDSEGGFAKEGYAIGDSNVGGASLQQVADAGRLFFSLSGSLRGTVVKIVVQ